MAVKTHSCNSVSSIYLPPPPVTHFWFNFQLLIAWGQSREATWEQWQPPWGGMGAAMFAIPLRAEVNTLSVLVGRYWLWLMFDPGLCHSRWGWREIFNDSLFGCWWSIFWPPWLLTFDQSNQIWGNSHNSTKWWLLPQFLTNHHQTWYRESVERGTEVLSRNKWFNLFSPCHMISNFVKPTIWGPISCISLVAPDIRTKDNPLGKKH